MYMPLKKLHHKHMDNAKNNRNDLYDKSFYWSTKWRKMRAYILMNEGLCRHCKKNGRTSEATEVDHIIPRRIKPTLELDIENLQPLCRSCHSKKTNDDKSKYGTNEDKNTQTKARQGREKV